MECRICREKLNEENIQYDYVGNEYCNACLQQETDACEGVPLEDAYKYYGKGQVVLIKGL